MQPVSMSETAQKVTALQSKVAKLEQQVAALLEAVDGPTKRRFEEWSEKNQS